MIADPIRTRNVVLVLDGDNTLWDTNAVFARAQSALLAALGLRSEGGHDLKWLREVDDNLVLATGRQEYDPSHLARACLLASRGKAIPDAVSLAMQDRGDTLLDDWPRIRAAVNAFARGLVDVPPLLNCVSSTLLRLTRFKRSSQGRLAVVLYSEGTDLRIARIVNYHHTIRDALDCRLVVGAKTVAATRRAIVTGRTALGPDSEPMAIIVGDRLDKEVTFAKQLGAYAIYVPGGYKGRQQPTGPHDTPDVMCESFCEIVDPLQHFLGIELA